MAATAAATRAPAAAGGFTAVELEMFAGVLLRAVRYGQALPVRLCGLNRVPPAASPRLAAGPDRAPAACARLPRACAQRTRWLRLCRSLASRRSVASGAPTAPSRWCMRCAAQPARLDGPVGRAVCVRRACDFRAEHAMPRPAEDRPTHDKTAPALRSRRCRPRCPCGWRCISSSASFAPSGPLPASRPRTRCAFAPCSVSCGGHRVFARSGCQVMRN